VLSANSWAQKASGRFARAVDRQLGIPMANVWKPPFSSFHTPQGDAMKLRPLHDRVIVKRMEQETKTASGIVIPDAAAEKPDQGEVLAIGNGKRNDKGELMPLSVKVGDRVLFGKYSGQTVKVDGDELLVMREEDLFAVVEK
jgi:chaperonin GroES